MKNTTTVYIVTAGLIPQVPTREDDLLTFQLESLEDVKSAARDFVNVIPDDLEDYLKDIADWDGTGVFTVSHQDDDYFMFRAQLAPVPGIPDRFNSIVSEYAHDDGDR